MNLNICDRIIFVKAGEIVEDINMAEESNSVHIITVNDAGKVLDILNVTGNPSKLSVNKVTIEADEIEFNRCLSMLVKEGITILNVESYKNGVVVKLVLGQALYYSFFNFFTLLACATMTVLISLLVKNGIIAICSSIIVYLIGSTMVLSLAKYEILKYSSIANIHLDGSEYFEGITEKSSIINILIHVTVFMIISVVLFYKRNADE